MKNFNSLGRIALFWAALTCLTGAAIAQENTTAGDAAQANNPLANFTAFNVHNYYIGDVTDTDKDGNQFWERFAKPFSIGETNWIMRASLPVNTFPVGPALDDETGLGDLNIFAAYSDRYRESNTQFWRRAPDHCADRQQRRVG